METLNYLYLVTHIHNSLHSFEFEWFVLNSHMVTVIFTGVTKGMMLQLSATMPCEYALTI